jgi:hypothetical protein
MDISPIRVVSVRCCGYLARLRWLACVMKKRSQDAKHGKVDVRSSPDAPTRAEHPIEHPRRDLKPSIRRLFGNAATEDRSVTLLDHFMDVDLPPGPGMPRIKELTLNTGPVGVPLSSCTMAGDRTRALTARHPIKPTSTRCQSASRPNPGRRSTYRRGKSVQTTGTTSRKGVGFANNENLALA